MLAGRVHACEWHRRQRRRHCADLRSVSFHTKEQALVGASLSSYGGDVVARKGPSPHQPAAGGDQGQTPVSDPVGLDGQGSAPMPSMPRTRETPVIRSNPMMASATPQDRMTYHD